MANRRATAGYSVNSSRELKKTIISNYQHQDRKEIRMVNGESVMKYDILCILYYASKHTVFRVFLG